MITLYIKLAEPRQASHCHIVLKTLNKSDAKTDKNDL